MYFSIFPLYLTGVLLGLVPGYSQASSSAPMNAIGQVFEKGIDPVSSVLGIVSFIMDNIPHPDDQPGTVVMIGVNEQPRDEREFDGDIRVVWAFNANNQVLGSSDLDTYIENGQAGKFTVHQHLNEFHEGQFIDILAGENEICISYVAAQFLGSDKVYPWTGDIGALCGQAWEHGMKSYGNKKNGDPYYPKCVWMDTDHGKDLEYDPTPITNRQMKIDITAYNGASGVKSDDYYCHATMFSWEHDDPIAVRPSDGVCSDMSPVCKQKHAERSLPRNATEPRPLWPLSRRSAEQLVVNSRPQQSAITLCSSPTSRGSDFASTDEGLFCDMETKILYPICDKGITEYCFDLDAEDPHVRGFEKTARRDAKAPRYKKITHLD